MGINFYQPKAEPNLKTGIENLQSLDNVWIDAQGISAEEEITIEKHFGIDLINDNEMRSLEDSSRFFDDANNLYLSITMPSRREKNGSGVTLLRRSYIRFIITPKTLISFHQYPFRALEIGKGRASARINGLNTPNEVFMKILEAIIERQAELLASIGVEVDDIAIPAIRGKKYLKAEPRLRKLGDIGLALSLSRDCLIDLSRMISFLQQHPHGQHLDLKKLRAFGQDVANLLHHAEMQSADLTFLLDATLGLIEARQATSLNFMAVVTLLFAPGTLIAGIFGMNFTHWQFLDHPNALNWTFIAMGLSALIVIGIAKVARLF